MIKQYTEEEFNNAKYNDELACECEHCHGVFHLPKHFIQRILSGKAPYNRYGRFCSKKCRYDSQKNKITIECEQCGVSIQRVPSNIAKFKHHFCSPKCQYEHQTTKQSLICDQCGKMITKKIFELRNYSLHFCSKCCSGKYTSQHKTIGSKRSKLELFLEKELTQLYPSLKIDYNRTNAIKGELDIYVPSLNLAFELNGVFHYEPIFGQERLLNAQTNDQRKFQACIENNIELCIIDVRSLGRFTQNNAKLYLNIVTTLINSKLS